MPTLAQIEDTLPWGFHDSHLESLNIDWLAQTLTMVLRLPMTEHQEIERRASVTVTGLFFCSIDPPLLNDPSYRAMPPEGLWLDAAKGAAASAVGLPALPAGVSLHHLLVQSWNFRAIHIAGRDASLTWLEEERPRTQGVGALFPGDEIPDP